jgi:hypothetical protein
VTHRIRIHFGTRCTINVVRQSHRTKTAAEDFTIAAMLVGISRIVPIAQALNFDAVWDGYDLLRELTRTVRLS